MNVVATSKNYEVVTRTLLLFDAVKIVTTLTQNINNTQLSQLFSLISCVYCQIVLEVL